MYNWTAADPELRRSHVELQHSTVDESFCWAPCVNGASLTVCDSQVEVLYGDEPLKDYYTLMDIAYFYEWRRVSDSLTTTFDLLFCKCSDIVFSVTPLECTHILYFSFYLKKKN